MYSAAKGVLPAGMAKFASGLSSEFSIDDVCDFFHLALHERENAGYSEQQLARLFDVKCGLGRMESDPAYYRENYCRPFAWAIRDILGTSRRPRILDVCCGTGGQTLLFAILGASVTAVDLDEGQLATLQERKKFYESSLGRELDITVIQSDVKKLDVEKIGAFDAIYSHIGIGGLEPAASVFAILGPLTRPGGVICLKNGNPRCVWTRSMGRAPRDDSRKTYFEQASAHGFVPERAQGTCGLPRQLWALGPVSIALSRMLGLFQPFQLAIAYTFRRNQAGQ